MTTRRCRGCGNLLHPLLVRDGETYHPLCKPLDPDVHARRSDPDTSHEAAEALTAKRTMMRRLLTTYRTGAKNTDEAMRAAGYTAEDGAWKRVSDLASAGYVEDTGERRPGESGRNQVVRRITMEGWEALRADLRGSKPPMRELDPKRPPDDPGPVGGPDGTKG